MIVVLCGCTISLLVRIGGNLRFDKDVLAVLAGVEELVRENGECLDHSSSALVQAIVK